MYMVHSYCTTVQQQILGLHINPQENIVVSLTALILLLFPSGASASELVLQCTPEGIRLQCYMSYYTEEMKTVWKHKYALRCLADRACGQRGKGPSRVLTLCSSVVKGE